MRSATNYLVIHCSATPASMDIGASEIRAWHKARGWSDIGYHYVIRRNGKVEEGRDIDAVGAHVKGHNSESVGICMVGGVGLDETGATVTVTNFTRAQWQGLERLIYSLKVAYREAVVIGHRDFDGVTKDCPTFDAPAWWANR